MMRLGGRLNAGSGSRRKIAGDRPVEAAPPVPHPRSRRRRMRAASDATAAAAPPPQPPPDYDRVPALFVSEDAFSLPTYWDRRYEQAATGPGGQAAEEWYRDGSSCEATQAVVAAHLDPLLPVLQLGVGTSRLQEAMARGFAAEEEDGGGEGGEYGDNENDSSSRCFSSVLSVDFSAVAIARQKERHAVLLLRLPRQQGEEKGEQDEGGRGRRAAASTPTHVWAARLSYAQADVRRMPHLADASFGGGVLDKGALDALLCGDDADGAAAQCLREAWRVLGHGAAYVMITSAAPAARRRLLPTVEEEGGDSPCAEGAASSPWPPPPPLLPRWAGVLVYRLGMQGALAGPVALGDAGAEAALLAAHEDDARFRYSHYAYVCVKG